MKEKTKRVLAYIARHDGVATTHDLTTETEISDNDAARYQLKKLASQGLVDLDTVEEEQFTTKRATLTEAGRQQVDSRWNNLSEVVEEHSHLIAQLLRDLDEQDVIDLAEYRDLAESIS